MTTTNDIIPFTGDATILARCVKMYKKEGLSDDVAMHRGFMVACSRPFDATRKEDVDHVNAAWTLIESGKV